MPVGFKCEVCNYARELPDTYAGRKIRCPQCAAAVEVPAGAPVAAAAPLTEGDPGAAPAADAPTETRPCPFCAEPIKKEARKCRWCGEIVDRQLAIAKQQEKIREVERRREILLKEAPGAKGSLIIGIVGILMGPLGLVGFLLGPIAIVMALSARRAIRKEPRLEGRNLATAGLVLGIITIAATIIMLATNVSLISHSMGD